MGLGKKLKKGLRKINRAQKKIVKNVVRKPLKSVVRKPLKKVEKKLRKPVKKLGRSVGKVLKEAAIPVIITIATGGTGAAIATTIASTAAARTVTKNIKDPVISAAVGAAIGGYVSGSSNLIKDAAKAAVATEVAKRTKSSAAGMIIAGAVVGDIKDSKMLQRTCAKEITKEVVSKKVYKKTQDAMLSQGVGALAGIGAENICIKLQERQKHNYLNKRMIEEQESKQEVEESKQQVKQVSHQEVEEEFKQQEVKEESKLVSGQRKFKKSKLIQYDINNFNTSQNSSQSIESLLNNESKYDKLIKEITMNMDVDTNDVDIGMSKTINTSKNSQSSISVSQNSLSASNNFKVTKDIDVGSNISLSNTGGLSGGLTVKRNNITNEYGVGIDKKWSMKSEVYSYHSSTIEQKNNVNVCISKETYRNEMKIPTCGVVGSSRQIVTTCPSKTTITNRVGVNGNGAFCGVTMIPVVRGASIAGKGMFTLGNQVVRNELIKDGMKTALLAH